MRLYTRTGATALDHPVFGHFDANSDGGFDFPNELSDQLHGFAVGGRPLWETDVERQNRLIGEELERRKDPATLLGVVEQLMRAAQAAGAATVAKQEAPVEAAVPSDAPDEPEDEPAAEKATRAPRKTAASRRTPKAAE
jgi:hypothetical protein